MKATIFAISLLLSFLSLSLAEPNNRPIIGKVTIDRIDRMIKCKIPAVGILSQRLPSSLDEMLPEGHNFTTYIAASYVKWAEAAGARVVPIVVRSDPSNLEYYTKVGRTQLQASQSGLSTATDVCRHQLASHSWRGRLHPFLSLCRGEQLSLRPGQDGQRRRGHLSYLGNMSWL